MLRSKPLRIALVLVLLAGIGAILWSYLSRRNQFRNDPVAKLLSSEITRQSKEFEYSQLKRGKLVFKVFAGTNTLTKEGLQHLEEVSMIRFDPEGAATDAIEGRGAIYRVDEKKIEFSDNVVITLSDGARIYADRAGADLEEEVFFISESFEFERGGVRGRGKSLAYSIATKRIEIEGDARITFPSGGETGLAQAKRITYSDPTRSIRLLGGSEIEIPRYRLMADEIQVSLTPERKIEKVRSFRDARLLTKEGRQFAGEEINLFLDPETGSPREFEAIAGQSPFVGTLEPAVYLETTPEGYHQLEAASIDGRLRSAVDGFMLQQLRASHDVVLRSNVLAIESCQASRFEALISEGHQGFEKINLQGKVVLVRRRDASAPAEQEVLHSDQLEITFDPRQQVKLIGATGNVDVELNSRRAYRHLSAARSMELSYQDGFLERATAWDDCVLRSIYPEGKDTVRAPRIEAYFSRSEVERVLARGGVDLELISGEESVRHTRSEQLEITYEQGLIKEANQWGNFRFWDRDAASSSELLAERARYDPRKKRVITWGDKRSVLRTFVSDSMQSSAKQSETLSEEFILDREENRIAAKGKVESVVTQNGEPLVITADKMQIDLESGWICYTDEPRLVQGPSLVQGNSICINTRGEELNVRGEVRSLMVEGEQATERRYEATADEMFYEKQNHKVVYDGNVKVIAEDLDVRAPRVEMIFHASDLGELERIEASGGVEITEEERTWKGRKATYYRADDRVVVSGD
jgi:LPS export ABC transporter protein LptC